MLRLLAVPIELLRLVICVLQAMVDAARNRQRQRYEAQILINAPRDAVWRFNVAERMVLNGPPVLEITREPLPGSPDLWLGRVAVSGQPRTQGVYREIERDDANGIIRSQNVAHELSVPPEGGRDAQAGVSVTATAQGTLLTIFNELTIRSFRDRIIYPLSVRRLTQLIKAECEREAGTHSRLADLANHGLVLSTLAFTSFWYMFSLKEAVLLAIVLAIHEAGHAAAMLMAGVGIHAIYLVPFFGGAIVPKTAYGSEGRLGFIALMGPAMSLIPTLALFAIMPAGKSDLRLAMEMFAVINAANLLPIYPLDGGLVLNALIGSASRKAALLAGWIGVVAGLTLALHFHSWLIGIPFLLFALQRYLTGHQAIQLKPLSLRGGVALTVAYVLTFAAYALVIKTMLATRAF
ncbi:metalloprotease [Bradyrhizobium oligotrophicum]|uniref:metalloprotease n=1 Tax=Bradyrhizobium oligotrophicum TaxID=44255 RepID=UPI003EBEEE04